ncbi:MAG: hypothetical protein CM15mP74_05740 [Halieaceae bacterium]|nr:MAG: hypothetical protein CM15mP74_05740 [Halieaceae bacterium]
MNGAGRIGSVKRDSSLHDQRFKPLIACHASPIERQAQRECGLRMSTAAHGVSQIGQPGGQPLDQRGFEGPDRFAPCTGLRVIPLFKLCRQLQ